MRTPIHPYTDHTRTPHSVTCSARYQTLTNLSLTPTQLDTMDNSTIFFIASLLVAFVFLRWLISPIPQSVPDEFNIRTSIGRTPDSAQAAPNPARRTSRREITESMIEVVRAIAPQLTDSQIRYSLERSGSVEATVDEYMENLTLPFPPGEAPPAEPEETHNVAPSELKTLLEKYQVQDDGQEKGLPVEGKWGKDEVERTDLLRKRREEMILRARRRLQLTLSNDVIGE